MHFYSATETSENRFNPQDPRGRKANPRITSFPEQIEITAANIAEHCLGANARPYTALEFREKTFEDGHKVKAYRDTEHFIQAEAAMGHMVLRHLLKNGNYKQLPYSKFHLRLSLPLLHVTAPIPFPPTRILLPIHVTVKPFRSMFKVNWQRVG